MAACAGLEVSHYCINGIMKWYHVCGAGGVSLLAEREVVLWQCVGLGGVSLLAEREVVLWQCVGLGVSHYWQRGKWYYGSVWGWGCLTIGREGSGIMAVCGAGGVSLLAEREVVSWLPCAGLGVSHYWQRWNHEVVSWLPVGLEVSHYWQRGKWYHGSASGAGGVSLLADSEVVSWQCQWGWGCLTIGRQ